MRYTTNAIINCLLAQKLYPDWITRFYVDDTLPLPVEKTLRTFPWIEIIGMPRNKEHEGRMWRFLPTSETDTIMISRDSDSWLSIREKAAVDAWLSSDKDFHIIRDHCYHSQKIMAGMWGAKSNILLDMRKNIEEYRRERGNVKDKFFDQSFLADKIYPRIVGSLMSHYGDPLHNNKGELVNGYFNDGCQPIPEYQEWDEPVPGLSFREANKLNAFHCAHCGKTHDVLIGGITEHVPERAKEVVRKYAREHGVSLSI